MAVLLHARWHDQIIAHRCVSSRTVYVDVKTTGRSYRIVSIYLPHAGYSMELFNQYLNELAHVIADARTHNLKCVLGGDFKTELHKDWRGERLLEFAAE